MNKIKTAYLFIIGALVIVAYSNCTPKTTVSGQAIYHTVVGNPMNPGTVAALPQVYLNSNYPALSTNHNVWTVGATGRQFNDCQPAINKAQPGDEVVIDAGFVCSPIVLPNKGTSSSYIVIRTANLNLLPPQGTRISHSDAPNLAIVEVNGTGTAVSTAAQAHHYQLVGLNIRLNASFSQVNFGLVQLGLGTETDLSQLVNNIVIARSWIHAGPLQEEKYGVTLNGSAISIVDSVVEEIHRHQQYAIGIIGWEAGVGPFKIVDNEIEAAGMNFGLGSSTNNSWIPSDIQFSKNYVHKNPAWQQSVTSLDGETGPWIVDSLLKTSNVQRLLIDGNIFEYNWMTLIPNFASSGYAFQLSPFNWFSFTMTSNPAQSFNRVQDVTVSNNIIRHCAGGAVIDYQDVSNPLAIALRIDFENNLIYDIGSTWGYNGAQSLIRLAKQAQGSVTFNHNTLLDQAGSPANLILTLAGSFPQFVFTNNLTNNEGAGIQGAGHTTGAPTLSGQFPAVVLQGDVFAGQSSSNYSGYTPGNFFIPNMAAIGFVSDPSAGVTDYHTLELAPSSPYHNAAVDGTDIGANIPNIDGALK